MKTYSLAMIAGDGIGKEVAPAGRHVLEATGERFGIRFNWTEFSWGCDYYAETGRMMPADGISVLRRFDAIYFGAVGWPTVPDSISTWDLILRIRQELGLYVGLRPVRLMPGIKSPLVGRGPADIDMMIVRENSEGEYSAAGGRLLTDTEDELAVQTAVFTRRAIDRVLRYGFEMARKRSKRLAMATKSNAIKFAMPLWDERLEVISGEYPDITANKHHIDILAAKFVLEPDSFDVVVASNLFGDILSDLGPALAGSIGIAASANIDPSRSAPSMFEPVHGTAPDIAGRGIANPMGQITAGAMMLDHLGEPEAARAIERAIEQVLSNRASFTRDLGGTASTNEAASAVANAVRNGS